MMVIPHPLPRDRAGAAGPAAAALALHDEARPSYVEYRTVAVCQRDTRATESGRSAHVSERSKTPSHFLGGASSLNRAMRRRKISLTSSWNFSLRKPNACSAWPHFFWR
jgi:hypothetical protein